MQKLSMKGFFELKAYRDGKVIDSYKKNNLIVNGAYSQVANLIGGDVEGRSITHIAFGTNGTPPEKSDQLITNQIIRPVTRFEIPNVFGLVQNVVGLLHIFWEVPKEESLSIGIMEFGMLTGDGTLFSRITRRSPLYMETNTSLEGRWTFALSEEAAALFEDGDEDE